MVPAGNKAKRLSSVNPYHKNNSPSKGEFTATNSNAVIQKTKTFCCFFIALLESKLNFQQFEKKKKSLIAPVFLKLLTLKDVLT